jgi:hypothetical protein
MSAPCLTRWSCRSASGGIDVLRHSAGPTGSTLPLMHDPLSGCASEELVEGEGAVFHDGP